MKLLTSLALVFCLQSGYSQQDTITFMSLNVLNYPNGCGTNIVNREDTLRKICQYVQPDIFVICELQEEFGADSILNRSLNVYGANNYQRATWVPNGSSSNNLQNMLFYNSDKLVLQDQFEISTSLRDINHYVLYYNDPYLNVHQDTVYFEVYMAHLKAGTGTANETERDDMAQILRTYIDARPAGRNHFLCGDLNVYDDLEPCYQTLTTGGIQPFYDPINMPGDWHDDPSFALIHTQSPRTVNWDCGATGGSDDRFDQILVSQNVLNGSDSLTYIPDSYVALGQDGQHFDTDLIAAPQNSIYPDSLVNAVYYMSDHLPVVMEVAVQLPWDELTANGTVNHVDCHAAENASITVNPNGGTMPYDYVWDAATGNQTNQTAVNLGPGTYCLTIIDFNGYETDTCFTVTEPSPIVLSASSMEETSACNGSATINASGGTPGYSYQWEMAAGSQVNPTATNLCAGDYWCIVTDNNGCQDSLLVNVADSTGIGLLEFDQLGSITAYPNPVEDDLILDLSSINLDAEVEISIYAQDGRLIRVERIHPKYFQQDVWIDFSMMVPGEYILEIKCANYKKSLLIVKGS